MPRSKEKQKQKGNKKSPRGIKKPKINQNFSLNLDEEDTVKGWLLYSLRFTLLDKNVRNTILKSSNWFGKFKKSNYKIVLGDIYGEGIDNNSLKDLVNSYINLGDDKIILFTLSNNPRNTMDPDMRETHFQSFVMVNSIKTIFAFDPAMSTNIPVGIYYPGAIIQLETLFQKMSNLGYRIVRPEIQYACQVDKSDVFCQTWSLYLQYEFMRQLCINNFDFNRINIVIPNNIIDKYRLLNLFIQDIIKIKIVRETLNSQFNFDIQSHRLPKKYSRVDSLAYVSGFTENDYIYDSEIDRQADRERQINKLRRSLGDNILDYTSRSMRNR